MRIEEMMQTIGLIGTVLISCVIGILLGAAGIDMDRLARMTAVLSWLTLLTFGVRAVYMHKLPIVTIVVGVGIAQGFLYFFTEVDTAILSVMFDIITVATVIFINRRK
ncbi:MAG: hypothetical protein ACFFA4_17015 [Promethearchaeota archaeon]